MKGIAVDFEVDGDFPKYGNDDDRADELVSWILEYFMGQIKRHKLTATQTNNFIIDDYFKCCLR